ncbi:hypothetical protein BOX15_Mlig027034g1 [Macrostomum lignano]|uniref:Uncharacterized protein n=1 Tax=Macrostomum lignano TaxID=282301 RepID=A0A267H8H7_9PLAT|nr:hypothetical protein BOX15_Mlig027034g1 [Macrostomum lignano]
MSEKLGEIGKVLGGICDAIKTMKQLQDNKTELNISTEEAKKHADEVQKLSLPDEPLLDTMNQELQKVRSSGSKLEVWLQQFGHRINELERFIKANIRGGSISPEVVKEFCDQISKTHKMAADFSDAFKSFICYLAEAQRLAVELAARLKTKSEEMQQEASTVRNKGVAKVTGLAALSAGLVALGFFTGGVTWTAAGAVAGAAASAGASAVAYSTVVNVKAMRDLASGIRNNFSKLEIIAKNLKSNCDKVEAIQLDEEAMQALQAALEFYRRDLEKDELLEQKQLELQDTKAELAELKAKMRRLGHD